MSLKTFHIVFIAASVLLAFAFSGWLLGEYRSHGGSMYLLSGVGSFVAGAGLIVYGRYFLRKLRNISYF